MNRSWKEMMNGAGNLLRGRTVGRHEMLANARLLRQSPMPGSRFLHPPRHRMPINLNVLDSVPIRMERVSDVKRGRGLLVALGQASMPAGDIIGVGARVER